MDDEFLNETEGELESDESALDIGENAITELSHYISHVDWDNHDRKYFGELINCVRKEIKNRNFVFDSDGNKRGLLNYERSSFLILFKWIPLTMSIAAALVVGAASTVLLSLDRANDGVSLGEAVTATGIYSGLITAFILFATVGRVGVKFFRYDLDKKGERRLRITRENNAHLIESTLGELSGVVAERAVNEEPIKGASGLIQSTLTYIAEYNIRRTIKRCLSLFNIKVLEVDQPDIEDTRRTWMAAFVMSVIAAVVAVVSTGSTTGSMFDGFTTAAPFVGFMVLPTLAGLVVQWRSSHDAVKPGSFMQNRWDVLKDAYEGEPTDAFMGAADYTNDDRDRIRFSKDVAMGRVDEHARWLHETLTRYEKLKNRRMID
ncbi:MAG: hypothetical protein AAFR65_09010 [Pseudomonadota bacterium]